METKPSKSGIFTRILVIALGIPVAGILVAMLASVLFPALENSRIFISITDFLVALLALMAVTTTGLFMKWAGSLKTGNRILKGGFIGFFSYLAIAGIISTINTNQLIDTVDQLAIPAGFDRVYEGNGNVTFADTVFPCFDLQADGCPSVKRHWKKTDPHTFTKGDLKTVMTGTGLKDVSITKESCRAEQTLRQGEFSCFAEGKANGYDFWLTIAQDETSASIAINMREPLS